MGHSLGGSPEALGLLLWGAEGLVGAALASCFTGQALAEEVALASCFTGQALTLVTGTAEDAGATGVGGAMGVDGCAPISFLRCVVLRRCCDCVCAAPAY